MPLTKEINEKQLSASSISLEWVTKSHLRLWDSIKPQWEPLSTMERKPLEGQRRTFTGRENYSKSTSMTDPGGQNRAKNKRIAGITLPQLRSVSKKSGKSGSTGEFEGKKHTDD